jgi:peroxiredoxin
MGKNNSHTSGKDTLGAWLEPTNVVLFVAVVIALVAIFSYSRKNRSLAKEVSVLKMQVQELQQPEIGDVVPPIIGRDLQGGQIAVNYHDQDKTLLLIFSTTCPACDLQFSEWNRLAAKLKGKKVSMYGISLNNKEEATTFLQKKLPEFPVLIPANQAMNRSYRANTVPQTMLVAKHGSVEWLKLGRLTEDDVSWLLTKFE